MIENNSDFEDKQKSESESSNCNFPVCDKENVTKIITELENNKAKLEILHNLHTILQSSKDLTSIFRNVYSFCEKCYGGCKKNRFNLFIYDESRDGLVSENYFGIERFGNIGLPQPIGYSISGKCFQEGKLFVINNCLETDLIPERFVKELNLKTVAAVPVLYMGKPIGVLRVDNMENTFAFSEEDVELFILIADQLGLIIENVKLLEKQKKASEIIQDIDKIYRNTIANAQGIAYSFLMKNDYYDFISDKCEEVFGIPQNTISRTAVRKMVKETYIVDPRGPDDLKEYQNLFYKGERESYQVHLRIITPKGEKKWISDFSLPIKDPRTNEFIGFQGIIQDITHQKRNEQINLALLKISTAVHSANTLEELFPLIHNALSLIMDTTNFYIALLDKHKENITFPYAMDEIDTPPWEPIPLLNSQSLTAEILCSPKVLLLKEKELLERYETGQSKVWGIESKCWLGAPLTIKGDTIGAIAVQSYNDAECYKEEDKVIIQTLAEQVALSVERKQAEEALKKMNYELQKTNAEKDKFFSIIAHDFKSPFQGFLGMTQLMADEIEIFSYEELRNLGKSMNDQANNLYKLLENLLDWARMQRGTFNYLPERFDLFVLVFDNIEILNPRALQKGIELINKIPEGLNIFADKKMIDSVIRNLLTNAVKFSSKNGKVIVELKNTENEMIAVSVRDSGIGIPEKDLVRLFRIEEKVSTKGTDGEPSTGLGLLLCKEFIEKHKGNIKAESKVGQGSTFTFTLPIIKT